MGDVRAQLTPETPGRVQILNPFESPNDYSSLHEPFVSSPTVFKPRKSSATPRQFRWSIDQLAAINPIDIDPEDIHRQALYLSHAKLDKEMEDRRQQAIEEFFTKRTIVPSPWTQHEGKQAAQFHSTKCVDPNNESPLAREQVPNLGKSTVACQTQLSLPVNFDIEKVLGEYFRSEENADQSQENLSSSSLRRKLFLDGQCNRSVCSSPSLPSPGSYEAPPVSLGVLCSIEDLSPVRCRSPMQTPSSGQFSSSPIQGGRRAYSLGSIASPTFFENSPMREMSPAFSPISSVTGKNQMAEQKKLSFPSPETLSASNSMVNSCTASPLIEGCSPIKNVFQIKAKSCRESAQYRTALFQIPFTIDRLEEEKENSPPARPSLPGGSIVLQLHNMDTFSPDAHISPSAEDLSPQPCAQQAAEHAPDELRDNDTVEMVDPPEMEDDQIWVKDAIRNDDTPMASFMTGNTFSVEMSHMCMSPLAESSVIPCDNSSIQVDSGYTTQTCGSSIMDGIGTDGIYKEIDTQICENQNGSRLLKTKDFLTLDVKGHRLLEHESPERDRPSHKTHKTHPSLQSGIWKLSSDRQYNRLNKNVRLQSPRHTMDEKSLSH